MSGTGSFYESAACASRLHCDACRNNRKFRASVLRTYAVPTEPDYACPHGVGGVSPQPLTVKGIVRGAAGIAKALVGVDRAPPDVRAARLLACAHCANWTGNKCALCGCFTAMKVRIAGETCPLGWWGAVPSSAAAGGE